MNLEVGDTLPLNIKPDSPISVRCGDVILTEGRIGRIGDHIAVRIGRPLRTPTTTFAMFEAAGMSKAKEAP
jgi:flagellar motor switch protein FliM